MKTWLLTVSAVLAALIMSTGLRAQVNVVEQTASDLAAGYAAGTFTAVEVVQAFLDRIDQFEENYNAFTSFNPDALATAASLDQERMTSGPRGPMHGVPIVIKESMDVAGFPSTGGYAGFSSEVGGIDLIPETDAPLVTRLREAGAIILGKTNVPSFSLNGTRANTSWAGPTFNVYDRAIAPGGSSSGTATAVSGSFAVLGMAEETGGSIQNPAAAQALVSIKPTFGLVPNVGVMPLGGSTLDVVGPHAKTVYDAAITLDAIAGFSPDDPKTSVAMDMLPVGGYTSQLSTSALEGKRIGLFGSGWQRSQLTVETQTLYDQAIEMIRNEGAVVIVDPFAGSRFDRLTPAGAFDPRGIESFVHDFEKYLERLGPSAAANSIEELQAVTGIDLFGPQGPLPWVTSFVPRASIDDPDLPPDLTRFTQSRERMLNLFAEVMETNNLDALAFPQMTKRIPSLAGNEEIDALTATEINVMGSPGVTVPAGYYGNGSPFSLIFLGEPFSEAELLGYAFDFEQASMHRIAPELSVLGDFDGNGVFDVSDIDALSFRVARRGRDLILDLDHDGRNTLGDITLWIKELANSYLGDANMDGEFSSADLVKVFEAAEYEDGVRRNSVWSEGDWNGDGDFTSSDIVTAFVDGGYEQGPRGVVNVVPEPSGMAVLTIAMCAFAAIRRQQWCKRRQA